VDNVRAKSVTTAKREKKPTAPPIRQAEIHFHRALYLLSRIQCCANFLPMLFALGIYVALPAVLVAGWVRGTSIATGVTSGAVADLLQAAPQLTPDQAKALVMVNSDRNYFPVTSCVTDEGIIYKANYDVFTIGAGYLDIAKTVSAALAHGRPVPSGTAMSPTAVYDEGSGDTTMVIDPSALWTSSGLWSATGVYGSSAFLSTGSGSNAVWGSTALWGKNTTTAQTALWGKSDPGDVNVSVQY
jgi:hypothetical protein